MKISDVLNKSESRFAESDKRYAKREKLIYNITEDMLLLMEKDNISKKELAERLGKSKSYVTQVLSGARNMTLRTLSDICHVLKIDPVIALKRDGQLIGVSGNDCVNRVYKQGNVVLIKSSFTPDTQLSASTKVQGSASAIQVVREEQA